MVYGLKGIQTQYHNFAAQRNHKAVSTRTRPSIKSTVYGTVKQINSLTSAGP